MNGWFTSMENYLQGVDNEFVISIIKVIIFLLALAIGGMLLVRLYRAGGYCSCHQNHINDKDNIEIVTRKAVGAKSMLNVVKYGNKKFLICVNKDSVTCIGDVSNYNHKSFQKKRFHAKPPRSAEKV
jgi:flagellar biogenesis protein FliO